MESRRFALHVSPDWLAETVKRRLKHVVYVIRVKPT